MTDILTELSPDTMLEAARRETGLSDFGPEEFLEPFRLLVTSAAREMRFSQMGLMVFKADIHRCLVNRLRIEEDLRLHPQILDEDVSDPIVVLGLVRTGTTKLQRILSAGPHVQKLYFWRLLNPARFPGGNANDPDPRIAAARQAVDMLRNLAPDFMAAHPLMAEEVDEDLLMMPLTFETLVLYMGIPVRPYYDWIKHRRQHHTYRYLGRLMKYLQWQDGGKRWRPWIMKTPLHIGNLDALLEVFPKATLVHCHRSLTEVMPSFCRLTEAGLHLKTDTIDRLEVGRSMLELWETEMHKYLSLRQQLGPKLNILDVTYRQIDHDPIDVARMVYQHAGRALDAESKQAMLDWERNNPKNKFGKNHYSLEDYGLTTQKIHAAFGDYIAQFGRYLEDGQHHGG